MFVEMRPITSIRPYENNPRINEAAVDAVAASMKEFGCRQPIVVDEQGVIIVGHTRYRAALKLGWTAEHLEALKRLKEASAHAKELLAQQPDANDAYVALGTANYIIGSLSGGKRFLLRFGGIHGDKKLGMEQLGNTIEKGRYLQPYAKILLALAARREKQNPLAQKLFHELSEEFPESPLYAAEYAKAMGRPIPAQMHP